MRLLLDTHVLLWWLADDPRLARQARRLIANEPEVFASAASACEIASKRTLGTLEAPEDLAGALDAGGIARLPIQFEHAAVAGALPLPWRSCRRRERPQSALRAGRRCGLRR
jgi:PIN domain nuclease of toxin-antitoxin system